MVIPLKILVAMICPDSTINPLHLLQALGNRGLRTRMYSVWCNILGVFNIIGKCGLSLRYSYYSYCYPMSSEYYLTLFPFASQYYLTVIPVQSHDLLTIPL